MDITLDKDIISSCDGYRSLRFKTEKGDLTTLVAKCNLLGLYVTELIANKLYRIADNQNNIDMYANDVIYLPENCDELFAMMNLDILDLRNLDTSRVVSMRHMFHGCSVHSIMLHGFNTSNVTDMGFMFFGFRAQNLDISNFDTSKVVNMHGMFGESRVYTELNLTNFKTDNVNNMKYMFYDSKFKSINLTSFRVKDTTELKHIFYGCDSSIKMVDQRLIDKL